MEERTRLLKLAGVRQMTTLSTSEIYRRMRSGIFPEPVQLGASRVAWREDEIRAWIDARPRRGRGRGDG